MPSDNKKATVDLYELPPQRVAAAAPPQALEHNWVQKFKQLFRDFKDSKSAPSECKCVDVDKELNRFLAHQEFQGEKLSALRELYGFLTEKMSRKLEESEKTKIYLRLFEGMFDGQQLCAEGFRNRVLEILKQLTGQVPQDLTALLAQVREEILEKAARNSSFDVHEHNTYFKVAHAWGLGVWPINTTDTYRGTTASDEQIAERIALAFDAEFYHCEIIRSLHEKILAILTDCYGYKAGEPASKAVIAYLEKIFPGVPQEELLTPPNDVDPFQGYHVSWSNISKKLWEILFARDPKLLPASTALRYLQGLSEVSTITGDPPPDTKLGPGPRAASKIPDPNIQGLLDIFQKPEDCVTFLELFGLSNKAKNTLGLSYLRTAHIPPAIAQKIAQHINAKKIPFILLQKIIEKQPKTATIFFIALLKEPCTAVFTETTRKVILKSIWDTGEVDIHYKDTNGKTVLDLLRPTEAMDYIDSAQEAAADPSPPKIPPTQPLSQSIDITSVITRLAGFQVEEKQHTTKGKAIADPLKTVQDCLSKLASQQLVTDENKNDAIQHAAALGLTDAVSVLLDAKASVESANTDNATILCMAARRGHIDTVKYLLDAKANINARTNEQDTALNWAACNGHAAVVQCLLEHRATIDSAQKIGFTPLHSAAKRGHLDTVKYLLAAKANINARTSQQETPLSWAAHNGHAEIVKCLLENRATVDAVEATGDTPLHWTLHPIIQPGCIAAAKFLLDHGASVTLKNNAGKNALDYIAKTEPPKLFARFANLIQETNEAFNDIYGNEPISEDRLAKVVNRKDTKNGQTPLIAALQTYKKLQEQKADQAAHNVCTNTIGALLTCENLDIDAVDTTNHTTALIEAARAGLDSVVEILLAKGANKNIQTKTGETALEAAAANGHFEVVKKLLSFDSTQSRPLDTKSGPEGTAPALRTTAKQGAEIPQRHLDAALWAAVNGNHVGIIDLLLQRKANIEVRNKQYYTPLIAAAISGSCDTIERLLEAKASYPSRDTALFFAIKNGHVKAVELLLQGGANANRVEYSSGMTMLHLAVSANNENIVQLLLEAKANNFYRKNRKNNTVLDLIREGVRSRSAFRSMIAQAKAIRTLGDDIRRGTPLPQEPPLPPELAAITNAKDPQSNHTPLIAAIVARNRFTKEKPRDQKEKLAACNEIIDAFLEQPTLLLDPADAEIPTTALVEATRGGDSGLVKKLLEKKANIEGCDDKGNTALSLAAAGNHIEIMALLLERNANIENRGKDSFTPLMETAFEGHLEAMTLLLKAKANIDAQTRQQETALNRAAQFGHPALVKLLLTEQANIDHPNAEGDTPLILASWGGHRETVKCLLNKKAKVNTQTKNQKTALTWAAERGHVETVKCLLESHAELDVVATDDCTPLYLAADGRHIPTVKLLLNYGADVTRKGKWGLRPLESKSKFLEAAANNTLTQISSLFQAIEDGTQITQEVLAEKANCRSPSRETPLFAAIHAYKKFSDEKDHTKMENCRQTITTLLKQPTLRINAVDEVSQATALIKAARAGLAGVVESLLAKGADKNLRTHDEETALEAAAEEGHFDIVEMLLGVTKQKIPEEKSSRPIMPSFELQESLNRALLVTAGSKGHGKIVDALLKQNTTPETSNATVAAANTRKAHVIEQLLAAKAKINTEDAQGKTALLWAAETGNTPAIHALLAAGADCNITAPNGLRVPKELVRDWILALPSQNRDLYGLKLTQAVDPTTPLGGFFRVRRGIFPTNLTQGTLKDLHLAHSAFFSIPPTPLMLCYGYTEAQSKRRAAVLGTLAVLGIGLGAGIKTGDAITGLIAGSILGCVFFIIAALILNTAYAHRNSAETRDEASWVRIGIEGF